ncbi:DUF3886 domain-containing protein [Brevibacillus sp. SYP-B805]|uniref:DUF3886 domain-containing protein n=1 Tax=Brevibacillus sp. SYP-B805 TaxID=1578199 RepID=UPI0013EC1126|nr:DUF3886 domain-containing protein [Brevibacillus sp. SYP-B805]NGQ96642.1 DUF3886 domain-containing protein [Brevibacillus sp. SYP-B805]
MAKKRPKQHDHGYQGRQAEAAALTEAKAGHSLKELLAEDALNKLKQFEREMKAQKEQEAREEAERRREQEERERNKSFAELLEEYDKKGGGKYA